MNPSTDGVSSVPDLETLQKRALAWTQELVSIPSVTGTTSDALDFVETQARGLGFTCERIRGGPVGGPVTDNLYARLGSGHPAIAFAGHVDVVPTGPHEDWTSPPFTPDLRGGRMYGRGTADMKSAICCFLAAVEAFLEKSMLNDAGSLVLLITGDEEGPATHGTSLILKVLRERGIELDFCVTGEPTSQKVLGDVAKIGRRGSMHGEITVNGKQGHTGYPQLAVNAANQLTYLLHGLVNLELDDGSEHFEPSNLEITGIDLSTNVGNIIPGTARARFNLRFNDLHTTKGLIQRLDEALEKAAGGSIQFDVTYTTSGESFLTEPGRLTDTLAQAVETVVGISPSLETGGGTSDSRFICRACPVVDFGLVGISMHQRDEWINIVDLGHLTAIYREMIRRLLT